ncbi:alkylation response protein AidB-like acyl-CoA dehydrogenase [Kibdelosporangium banguiense]|uniref:Alkylation response protein AidB-like acyl-CoA dehydrogenase n=1 Tax=Kibdelosporangium banguiense TaxID=1365924 RepID=A0ABS4TIC8_9PSEU|nr:acyl-CoA dehydrogenase family protein [Kibdelosporangium banguiense]MBP2324183.1 alkylation response protein AidB-like acyl-CoA dehydrogenase [Kibdelosporangium banguiense]
MDFSFDETQREIADLTAAVLRRDPDQAWKALGQAGLLTLPIPERLGGDGLGVIETCAVLAEVGRAGVAVPALATLALGVLPIVHMGTTEQQDRLLAETSVLTAALDGIVTVTDGLLSGTKTHVLYAEEARWILVATESGVFIVDPADVSMVRTYSSSGTPEYTLTLSDAPGEHLGEVGTLRAIALAGAVAIGDGLLSGALALTSEHVRSREQFGKPLATFQAVSQQIADVYVAARTLHLAAWSAIWRLSVDRDPGPALDVAGYWLATELPLAMHTCHHLHGGIGVDISYPMHRFYSLGKDLVRFTGGAGERLDQLCSLI